MNRRWWILGCVVALGLGVTACDDDNGGTDAGPVDSGPTDSGPTGGPPVGFGADRGSLTAADYSCRGTLMAPAAGADATFDLVATDFFNGMPVEGLEIQFFPGNVPSLDGSCPAGTCVLVTSGADGTAEVTAPADAWYAYRIQDGSGSQGGVPADYVQVVQVNEPAPADTGNATVNAVSLSTQNTITALLSIEQQPGNGILTGQLTDCGGETIANAEIRVFDEAGQIPFGTSRTEHRAFYFNGDSLPLAAGRTTHVDGLYGAGNVPIPTSNVVRVELWGTLTEGGNAEMLGCEEVQVVPDGITVLNVGPTRADGPTTCSGL